MRRILFAWILIGGILIQLVFCMPAMAANLKTTTTKKYRITGVVKDALGRPIKDAALSLQDASGKVVANARSNDEGEFSLNVSVPGTYAVLVNKTGFKTATEIVAVKTEGAANLDIALETQSALSLQVATTKINPQ